jgi:ribonuclease HI
LVSLEGEKLEFAIKIAFPIMSNEAEYEAVLAGLGLAREVGARNLEVRSDS